MFGGLGMELVIIHPKCSDEHLVGHFGAWFPYILSPPFKGEFPTPRCFFLVAVFSNLPPKKHLGFFSPQNSGGIGSQRAFFDERISDLVAEGLFFFCSEFCWGPVLPDPCCWWTKSWTTTLGWCWNPVNNGISTISTGAGFQPSTNQQCVATNPFACWKTTNKVHSEATSFCQVLWECCQKIQVWKNQALRVQELRLAHPHVEKKQTSPVVPKFPGMEYTPEN